MEGKKWSREKENEVEGRDIKERKQRRINEKNQ